MVTQRSLLEMAALGTVIAGVDKASAQSLENGLMLSSTAHPSLQPYESLNDFSRCYFPRELFEEARAQTDFDILDFRYASGGVEVSGLLVIPQKPGDGDYGGIDYFTVVEAYQLAKSGLLSLRPTIAFMALQRSRTNGVGRIWMT